MFLYAPTGRSPLSNSRLQCSSDGRIQIPSSFWTTFKKFLATRFH